MSYRLSYEGWMQQVDREVYRLAAVSVHDLPDFPSWDWWADEVCPRDAAHDILAEEGFPFYQ